MENTINIANQWIEKVNDKNIKAVLEVSDPHIELVGPRGVAEGHDILQKWIEQSGIHMETQDYYAKGDEVICVQKATWEHQSGHVTIYTYMQMRNGKVHRLGRYDTLDDAFGECHLSEEDLVE
ncbi:nuclear transport factor 2 family protein [Planococcus halocryophilus]|uniref:nuclear transport factor 2 family protein n=1 Tax=Planococcus halocryophilus TaxID=1215089 RepID=UPI001F0FE7A4|nr:nuclear transport factor 2 family protein [Planococcus halocryophilus]MCH4827991.1 nuclear transport factor 2 family protein [Planococcus halocryophilus]